MRALVATLLTPFFFVYVFCRLVSDRKAGGFGETSIRHHTPARTRSETVNQSEGQGQENVEQGGD